MLEDLNEDFEVNLQDEKSTLSSRLNTLECKLTALYTGKNMSNEFAQRFTGTSVY